MSSIVLACGCPIPTHAGEARPRPPHLQRGPRPPQSVVPRGWVGNKCSSCDCQNIVPPMHASNARLLWYMCAAWRGFLLGIGIYPRDLTKLNFIDKDVCYLSQACLQGESESLL